MTRLDPAPEPTTPRAPPSARESLLAPFLVAVCLTALTAFVIHLAAARSVAYDLTGHVEALLPLTRLGILIAPFIVGVRTILTAGVVWLVLTAMHERATVRDIAVGVMRWLPVLEVPALVNAVAVLLQPGVSWANARVPLGLDFLLTDATGPLLHIAQSLSLPLLVWAALVARHLATRLSRGLHTAVPAATAAAAVIVVLPLLRG